MLLALPAVASLVVAQLVAARMPTIDRFAPTFVLDPIGGLDKPGLATADLQKGRVTLVNLFASWCVTCHAEAAALLSLSRSGVDIVGIAVQDEPADTRRFLDRDRDPYRAVGVDRSGRTASDFGITGLPETFVVRGDGRIAARIAGPLTDDNVRATLIPAMARAGQGFANTEKHP